MCLSFYLVGKLFTEPWLWEADCCCQFVVGWVATVCNHVGGRKNQPSRGISPEMLTLSNMRWTRDLYASGYVMPLRWWTITALKGENSLVQSVWRTPSTHGRAVRQLSKLQIGWTPSVGTQWQTLRSGGTYGPIGVERTYFTVGFEVELEWPKSEISHIYHITHWATG